MGGTPRPPKRHEGGEALGERGSDAPDALQTLQRLELATQPPFLHDPRRQRGPHPWQCIQCHGVRRVHVHAREGILPGCGAAPRPASDGRFFPTGATTG